MPDGFFSTAFMAAFQATYPGYNEQALQSLASKYDEKRPFVDGAPPIEELTAADVDAVDCINTLSIAPTADGEKPKWSVFAEAKANARAIERDTGNLLLPIWVFGGEIGGAAQSKTNSWCSDLKGATPSAVTPVNSVIKRYAPYGTSMTDAVWEPPIDDELTLFEVIRSCLKVKDVFVWPRGSGDDPLWRFGPSLCLLSGFGMAGFRQFANSLADTSAEWQAWSTCSDEELTRDLQDARSRTGYPCGLLRADAPALLRAFDDAGSRIPPTCLAIRALITLHIIKHVRLQMMGEKTMLVVTYDGRRQVIAVPPGMFRVHFGSPADGMKTLYSDLCRILKLGSYQNGLEDVVNAALSTLAPENLPLARPLSKHPEILCAPNVRFEACIKSDRGGWINPGMRVSDIAIADMRTRQIDSKTGCSDHRVGVLAWPLDTENPTGVANWRMSIPSSYEAMSPAECVEALFPHLLDLGYREGRNAIINTVVFLDLFRESLAGTAVGASLLKEYPMVCAFPKSGEETKTHNQGKTTLATLLGRIVNPEVSTIGAPKSSSPPDNRTVVVEILRAGHVVLDELLLMDSTGSIINKANIQILCTGNSISYGLAMENIRPFGLRRNLYASSKMANFPPDIIGRLTPLVLDVFPEGVGPDPLTLAKLESGVAYQVGRLGALAWAADNNLLLKIKTRELNKACDWRFTGHASVVDIFGTHEQVNGYFRAAREQMIAQQVEAESTGLPTALGVKPTFDPYYYFEQMNANSVMRLELMLAQGPMRPLEVLQIIIENGGERRFGQVIKEYFLREQAAIARFKKAILAKPFTTRGLRLSAVERKIDYLKGSAATECLFTLEKLDEQGNVIPKAAPVEDKTKEKEKKKETPPPPPAPESRVLATANAGGPADHRPPPPPRGT